MKFARAADGGSKPHEFAAVAPQLVLEDLCVHKVASLARSLFAAVHDRLDAGRRNGTRRQN